MKKIILVLGLVLLFCNQRSYSEEDPFRPFINSINEAWTNRNYALILQEIDARLATNANDILALGLKQSYYFYCDFNISNAQQAAYSLTNAVFLTGEDDVIHLADKMTELIMDIPTSTTGGYTQVKRDALHEMYPDIFPGLVEALQVSLPLLKLELQEP